MFVVGSVLFYALQIHVSSYASLSVFFRTHLFDYPSSVPQVTGPIYGPPVLYRNGTIYRGAPRLRR